MVRLECLGVREFLRRTTVGNIQPAKKMMKNEVWECELVKRLVKCVDWEVGWSKWAEHCTGSGGNGLDVGSVVPFRCIVLSTIPSARPTSPKSPLHPRLWWSAYSEMSRRSCILRRLWDERVQVRRNLTPTMQWIRQSINQAMKNHDNYCCTVNSPSFLMESDCCTVWFFPWSSYCVEWLTLR